MKVNLLITFFGCLFVALAANAQNNNCSEATQTYNLDINNVNALLLNGGDLWGDPWLQSAGYEVPKEGGVHSIFSGGFWIGGIDNGGQLRMAAQTYRQQGNDFWPGPIDSNGTTNADECESFDGFFPVFKTEVEAMESLADEYDVSSGGTIPISEVPHNIRHWPALGNPYFQDANGVAYSIGKEMAPFVNVDGEEGYDPTKGDYPKMRGDEMVWWVFNDVGNAHGETGGPPLGIEVHASAYGYNANNKALNNATFYNFEIHFKNRDLEDVYLGMMTDVDLGDYMDDYVGCDTLRDLGIGYNGSEEDGGPFGYGQNPPFVGIDFLKVTSRNNENRGMSNFMMYTNSPGPTGNPFYTDEYYNYLKSIWKDESHLTFGGDGTGSGPEVNHIYNGEPDNANEWSECQANNAPGDRRMLLSSGPYDVVQGNSITLDFAVIWARCSGYELCPSFDCIQQASDEVQSFFDTNTYTALQKRRTRDILLAPNPASSQLQVQLDTDQIYDVKVFSAAGRLIKRKSASGNMFTMDVSNWSNGMYLLSINNGRIIRKFMVQSK